MPKSRKRGGVKKHKKRVKSRNEQKIAREKRIQKIQREMFEKIMLEKDSGAFDETKSLDVDSETEDSGSDSNNELEL